MQLDLIKLRKDQELLLMGLRWTENEIYEIRKKFTSKMEDVAGILDNAAAIQRWCISDK